MKIKSLGLKVSLIVALAIAVIVVIIIYIVSVQSNGLVARLAANEAKASNTAFALEIRSLQDEAFSRARIIASSFEVISAIVEKDDILLKEVLDSLGEGLDVVTLSDPEGNVLMRMHSDQKGDNVLNQKALAIALKTGLGISTIEKGTVAGLSTRGSSVIKDQSGSIIGAITCGHDLANPKYVDQVKQTSNCEATLFDGDTRLMTTLIDENGDRVVGTSASDAVVDMVIRQRKDFSTQINLFGKEYYAHYSPLIIDNEVIGMLFTGVNIDQVMADQQNMMKWVLATGIICGLLCIVLVFVFNLFLVSKPLKKIGVFAEKIKTGDLGIAVKSEATIGVRSYDEVGMLAKALEQAYLQLRGYVGEIKERMSGLADGDLATESSYEFFGDFILIKDSIIKITRNLNQIMSEINSSSVQVSTGSKQVADGSQALAQGSTEQAASIDELSTSIAEINIMAKNTNLTATEALDEVQKVAQLMEVCMEKMTQMLIAMQTIDEKSQQISKTTKMIDDIAFQTNILALNAAVEAARAGQHGKGFAVVAEEVRNLASKSAEAARDTSALIESSSRSVAEGNMIVEQVNESLQAVARLAQQNAEKITEVQSFSTQQSGAMERISIGVDQVAQVVQQNSATAEESAAASEQMSGQSDMLQQMIAKFKLRNDRSEHTGLPATGRLARTQPLMSEGPGYESMENSLDFGKY